ncbi:hypothetical protein CAP36_15845 [Chitinophagaceae bacterium IBVUCB2]|nr:hypothetical protein CAP36_15845 [Chitinophagaceae bacterium IBVUCB2]
MASKATMSNRMRIWHRYLGFFLAGIMAVYAISGVVLIFRNTDFLKYNKITEKKLEASLPIEEVGKAIKLRDLKSTSENSDTIFFAQGYYNKLTGDTKYTVKALPVVMEKLTHLHKANTTHPLYYLNIFFGLSLLFFVLSSFWMFLPRTSIFKKGLYYAIAGFVLTVILLFIK